MPMVFDAWASVYRWQAADRVQEVTASIVADDTRSMADLALAAVAEDLGLGDHVRLRWFAPESESSKSLRARHGDSAVPWVTFETDGELLGCVNGKSPSDIWLRWDLDELDVPEVVAHEGRHASQYQRYIDGLAELPDDEAGEREADAYAADFLARLELDADEHEDLPVKATTPPAPRQAALPGVRFERKAAAPFYGVCHTCGDRRIPIPSPSRHVCPAPTGGSR